VLHVTIIIPDGAVLCLTNYAPCFHSLVMWFIGGCFGITQGKKMALVNTCMPDAQVMQVQIILLDMVLVLMFVYVSSFQICGKRCHKTSKRSPSYHSRGQSHLMNWNMIDVKSLASVCGICACRNSFYGNFNKL
jgi:hypothetical protein